MPINFLIFFVNINYFKEKNFKKDSWELGSRSKLIVKNKWIYSICLLLIDKKKYANKHLYFNAWNEVIHANVNKYQA